MLRLLLKWRNGLSEWIIVLSPILAILLMYVLKLDLAIVVAKFIPPLAEALSTKPGLAFTINTALIALSVNLFMKFFKSPGKLEIDMKSLRTRKDNSVLEVQNPRKRASIDLTCNTDFRFMWLRNCIGKLGNINLVIHFPHWIDYSIENEDDFKRNTIKKKRNEDQLEIDLGQALQKRTKKGKISLILKIAPNLVEKKEEYIISEFMVESNNMVKKGLICTLIILFLDFKESQHLVEARNDD